tara:strand:+ start:496 stop:1047 length:552 start_codon:yes stop_codon:yes gene_type:complete
MSTHYIDNSVFLEAMGEYKKECNKATEKGEQLPPVTDYIAECFMKIAQRLSFRPNFINYAFKDDMISDGIENCLQYAYNFDPEKSKNPFAYFTQIIYYAFIRRIQKEKKQLYIKYKTMEKNELLQDNIETEKHDKESRYVTTVLASDKKTKMYDFIDAFEQSKKKASKKKPTTSNSLFTDSNE